MTIRKRNRQDTKIALVRSLVSLCDLLGPHGEDEAIACLQQAAKILESSEQGSAEFKSAIALIINAFEDEHELMAYTFHRDSKEWTEVEKLAQASSRVFSLARNFR